MDAKDTVMKQGEMANVLDVNTPIYWSCTAREAEVLCEAQAEISFKAGYKQGAKNHHECCEMDYQAGIKEVLKFIPLQEYLKQSELIEDVPIWIGVNWRETQAKLKEWGIDG